MYVFVLHIDGLTLLTRAFDLLMGHPDVASCAIEPELCRVRFVAKVSAGDELVERIYLDGGLAWCSRHPLD